MFPVHERYISPYYSYHQIVKVNYKDIPKIHKQAKKVIGLLNRGIQFTDTSPKIPQIIKKQLDYIKSTDSQAEEKF